MSNHTIFYLKRICRICLIDPPRSMRIELFRYILTGCAVYIVNYAILFSFTEFFKINYLISDMFGFISAMLVNYLICAFWVFLKPITRKDFMLFILVGVGGLIINQAVLFMLTDLIGIYYLISKNGALFVAFIFTFLVRKYGIYSKK